MNNFRVSSEVWQACSLCNLEKPKCECASLPFIRILICSVYQNFSSAHDDSSNIFILVLSPYHSANECSPYIRFKLTVLILRELWYLVLLSQSCWWERVDRYEGSVSEEAPIF